MRLRGKVMLRFLVCLVAAVVFSYAIGWIFVGYPGLNENRPALYFLYVGFFLIMWIYSDSTLFDRGLLTVRNGIPRLIGITVALLIILGTMFCISNTENETLRNAAPFYAGLAMGYGLIFLMSLFGAGFLGFFSQFLKLGRRD